MEIVRMRARVCVESVGEMLSTDCWYLYRLKKKKPMNIYLECFVKGNVFVGV